MTNFFGAITRFKRDTRGMMMVEAVIILPVLIWAFMAFLMIWDGYRAKNLAQKATFAIADIISRERAPIRINSARNFARVFAYTAEVPGNINTMNLNSAPVVVRITGVGFIEGEDPGDEGTISLMWSFSSNTTRMPAHTAATLAAIRNKIPAMEEGDNVVIVETILDWEPEFTATMASNWMRQQTSAWMQSTDIETFTTVRPRFVPKVCSSGTAAMTVACEL